MFAGSPLPLHPAWPLLSVVRQAAPGVRLGAWVRGIGPRIRRGRAAGALLALSGDLGALLRCCDRVAVRHGLEPMAVSEVIDELIDYTLSHFAFEEELMEEAGYPFCAAHKRVHEVFGKRVSDYRIRFQAGEDIADELRAMLARWLFNHIRGDDQAYAETVKRHLDRFTRDHDEGRWLPRTLRRLFG